MSPNAAIVLKRHLLQRKRLMIVSIKPANDHLSRVCVAWRNGRGADVMPVTAANQNRTLVMTITLSAHPGLATAPIVGCCNGRRGAIKARCWPRRYLVDWNDTLELEAWRSSGWTT
jgi:hypothetical protein